MHVEPETPDKPASAREGFVDRVVRDMLQHFAKGLVANSPAQRFRDYLRKTFKNAAVDFVTNHLPQFMTTWTKRRLPGYDKVLAAIQQAYADGSDWDAEREELRSAILEWLQTIGVPLSKHDVICEGIERALRDACRRYEQRLADDAVDPKRRRERYREILREPIRELGIGRVQPLDDFDFPEPDLEVDYFLRAELLKQDIERLSLFVFEHGTEQERHWAAALAASVGGELAVAEFRQQRGLTVDAFDQLCHRAREKIRSVEDKLFSSVVRILEHVDERTPELTRAWRHMAAEDSLAAQTIELWLRQRNPLAECVVHTQSSETEVLAAWRKAIERTLLFLDIELVAKRLETRSDAALDTIFTRLACDIGEQIPHWRAWLQEPNDWMSLVASLQISTDEAAVLCRRKLGLLEAVLGPIDQRSPLL
ncbi:hypothetical protein LBMAG52_05240 [Planctomycetia bacterium]|nr:hypothetical protein LBMAG52_05240 [Planctomycetia bacterium]